MQGAARLVVAAIWLAGCAQSPEPTVASGDEPEPALQSTPEVFGFSLRMIASAGNQSALPLPANVQWNGTSPVGNGGPFDVQPNATAILVEARWICDTSSCAFRLQVDAPGEVDAFSVTGDLSLRFSVPPEAVERGTWGVVLRGDSATTNVMGEIRVSVFYGQEIGDEYSAFA